MIHTIRFKDDYAVLDVESGSIHKIDKDTYDFLNNKDPECDSATLSEIKTEIDLLKQKGLLFSSEDGNNRVFNTPVIKALCLHVAHDCNLRCKYCFANTGDYHAGRGLMPKEVATAALDLLIKESGNRKNLEVDFFGGEPLLNFETVKHSIEYGNELALKRGKNIRFTMTTNGYYVTDEMIDFINSNMKNLVISIDGREDIHNKMRPTAGGKESYTTVINNARRLLEDRGSKEYYIRGTYTKYNLDFSNDVIDIVEHGFNSVSIEPVISSDDIGIKETDLDRIKEEYGKLADIYERYDEQGKPFTFFHFNVNLSSGPCLNKRSRGCGAGLEYIAVTPKGDIFPCHQFVEQKEYLMGNVFEGIANKNVADVFHGNNIYQKPSCSTCWAKYYCSGGCAADAYFTNGNIQEPDKVSCEIEKNRLEIAIMLEIRKKSNKKPLNQ